jgi:two-component system chemotaxis response regulator CheY
VTAKIMIVDDSGMSRRTLRRILEPSGYDIVEADDGIMALELYYVAKPDLVLLDLVMKGMYGLDVLTKLREMDPNARIIIASADIQSSTRTMGAEAGAQNFVTKPFIREEVLNAIEQALRQAPGGQQT